MEHAAGVGWAWIVVLLNSTEIRILFLLNSTEIRGRRLLHNFMTIYTECMKVMCELYK